MKSFAAILMPFVSRDGSFPAATFFEGACVSNAAAHICAAATGSVSYARKGLYLEYSYRYL